jgi:23S rRNA (pseudouridine1915-N3)-methyltransferase
LKVKLITIAKSNFPFVADGAKMYVQRMRGLANFTYDEVHVKLKSKDVEAVKKEEGMAILKKCEGSKIFLFDERGKSYSSEQFAKFFEKQGLSGTKSIALVIGGSYGFSDEVYAKSTGQISLSAMTFSHQLVRVLALEQIYRAHTIIKGLPYHHA